MPIRGAHASQSQARSHAREYLWLVGRLFPPGAAIDAVTTRAAFEAPPDEVWQQMMFYEEVPHRPPLLLRIFLPSPVKTQGNDKHVGASVECSYSQGGLVKRITVLDRPGSYASKCSSSTSGSSAASRPSRARTRFAPRAAARRLRSPRGIAGTCGRAGCGGPSSDARAPAASPHPGRHGRERRWSERRRVRPPHRGALCRRQLASAAPASRRRCPTAGNDRRRPGLRAARRRVRRSSSSTTIAPGAAARETARKSRRR